MKKGIIKKLISLAMVGMLSVGMVACSNSTDQEKGDSIESKKIELKYANGFNIEYLEDGIKKVTDGDSRELILVPKKIEIPDEYKDANIVRTPVDNVLVGSTTFACSLRTIDEIDSIKAVTTEANTWTIEEIKEKMDAGDIEFVGNNSAPDYEKIVDLNPELAIVYSGSGMGDEDFISKLEELDIPYIVDNEWLEENPFGRMEWSKLVAALYDKEDVAAQAFDNAIQKVEETSKKINSDEKTKVAWAQVYEGTVYVAKKGSYVDKMIEMAGGENIFNDIDAGTGQISVEQLHEVAKDADVFIYSSTSAYTPNLQYIIDQAPVLSDFKSIQEGNLWVFHPDYWQSIDKTDEVIIDLMEIFHPGSTGEDVKHYINYKN